MHDAGELITASTLSKFYKQLMSQRDARVAQVNELLAAIALVKSNGWEDIFTGKIRKQRTLELGSLLKYPLRGMHSTMSYTQAGAS